MILDVVLLYGYMGRPEAQATVVPTLQQAIKEVAYFPQAIQTLVDADIKTTTICKSFGIGVKTLRSWRRGQFLPADPAIYLAITRWAELLRQQHGS